MAMKFKKLVPLVTHLFWFETPDPLHEKQRKNRLPFPFPAPYTSISNNGSSKKIFLYFTGLIRINVNKKNVPYKLA